MTAVNRTEFCDRIREYLDAVERGEEIEVLRQGKPIAKVLPARKKGIPHWKQPFEPLKIPGVSLAKLIIEDREDRF